MTNTIVNEICQGIIGKSIDLAIDCISIAGLTYRLREVNGHAFVGTCDVKPSRINLVVVGATKVTNKDLSVEYIGGKVTKAYSG